MSEKIEIIKLDDVTPYLAKIDRKDAEPLLSEEVSENGDEVFFIRVSDTIVGTAYISDEARAFVYVYIFPEYRNRGYGESAVSAAEQRMMEASIEGVETIWKYGDEHAKRFAERNDYKRTYASAMMAYRGEPFPEEDLPIRQYRDEDYPEAFALSADAFHAMRLSTGWFPDSVTAQPSEASRKGWANAAEDEYVYVLDGEIVGYARLDETEMDSVSIKIPHQGKGLGRKFVRYLTNRILEKDDGEPTLRCVVGNSKARALYDSLGFEEFCCNDFGEKTLGE